MNAWAIRPYPHQKPRMREFIKKQIIAIGWPNIGDLTDLTLEQIEARNREQLRGRSDNTYRQWTLVIKRFRDEVETGDLVIVAPKKSDSESVSIGVVDGGYTYDPETDGDFFGYPHHKPVRWLRHKVRRSSLPLTVAKSLRSQGTLFRVDGDSLAAFCTERGWMDGRFNIVDQQISTPRSHSTRRRTGTTSDSHSKVEDLRMAFWTLYGDCVERTRARFTGAEFRRPSKSSQQRQQVYRCFGRPSVFLVADFIPTKNVVRAHLALKTPAPDFAKHHFDLLNEHQPTVEMELRELGVTEKPVWDRKDGTKHSTVSLEKSIDISADDSNWETACMWMINRLQALERVFRDRVAEIT